MKTFTPKKIIIFILSLVVIALCLIALIRKAGLEPQAVKTYDISGGWNVEFPGSSESNVSLNDFSLGRMFERGKIIRLYNTLPSDIPPHAGLRIFADNAVVEVEVDGRSVYEYGRESFMRGRTVGSGYHFVDLPADAAGKDIAITVTFAESFVSNARPDIELTAGIDMFRKFVSETAGVLFIDLFLLLLGIVLLIVSLAFVSVNRDYLELTGLGLFSVVAASWGLCSQKFPEIIGLSITANSILEFSLLYSAPMVFLILILSSRQDISRARKSVLRILLLVCMVFFLTVMLFFFTNVMHLPRVRRVFDIVVVSIGIAAIIFTRIPKKRRLVSDRIFEISLIIVVVTGAYEMLRKDIRTIFPGAFFLKMDLFTVGILIFVVGMLTSYMSGIYRRTLDEQEVLVLKSLASVDSMTGLSNRKKANLVLEELDSSKDPYLILSFDLNGLKKVNDRYGHETGDSMILTFSKLLTEVFKDTAELFRMGGDEFIAVLKNDNIETASASMRRLVSLEKEASEDESYRIDCSFGASLSTEFEEPKSEEVLRLSDKRMYEMKSRTGRGRD